MGKTPEPPKAPAPEPKAGGAPNTLPDAKKTLSDYELLAEMLEQNPEFASCW